MTVSSPHHISEMPRVTLSNIIVRKPTFSVNSPAPLTSQLVTLKSRFLRRIIAALLTLATLLATPAHAEWREATSDHFIIVSGGPEEELVRFSKELEAVHWLMTQATGLTEIDNGPKVRIYLMDRLYSVHAAMGQTRDNPAAGFYRTTHDGAYAVVPRDQGEFSTTVLYHEYAHHFMLQHMNSAFPPWFVEGFAEVVSTASFEQPGKISYGRAASHRADELHFVTWVPTTRMFAPRSRDDERAGVASYGQYWLTAHYFIFSPDRRGQLARFITATNSGQSPEQAYGVFTGGIDRVDSDLRRYLRQRSFPYVAPELPADVMRAPVLRLLRPGEEATVDEELQASRPMSAAAHIPVAARVAQVAVRYPADPAVALLHARLLYYAERYAEAEAAVDRTLVLEPRNVRALTLKGQIMLAARLASEQPLDAALLAAARGHIIRANRIDPEDQVPLIAYFESFKLADEAVPDAALAGLFKAAELVPQETDLRMTLARELLDRRDLPEARFLLAPLAYAPHRSPQQGYALQLMQWIDAGAQGTMPQPSAANDTDEEEEEIRRAG